MSHSQVSPFAALTGDEKQLKWLEYQSIRLPYVQGSVEPGADTQNLNAPTQSPKMQSEAKVNPAIPSVRFKPTTESKSATNSKNPVLRETAPATEKKQTAPGLSASDFQTTRHRQYDAVIERMKKAEKNTRSYQPLA